MSHLSFSLRRVQKEIENFKNKKHNYRFKILEFFDNLKFEILSQNNKNYLMIYDKYLNLFTQLEIEKSYPFKPYDVVYLNLNNSLPYLKNLNNLTSLFKKRDTETYEFFFRCMYSINPKFLKLDKYECYCCKSLMCKNEWCPNFTFTNLLLEQVEIKFINCYSSNLGYRYIKNIYDTLFIKLNSDIILHISDYTLLY
jgi:hypothetical protein